MSLRSIGALVIKETLKRANLKTGSQPGDESAAPDALKDQGLIDLEKKAADWVARRARRRGRGDHGQRPAGRPGPEPGPAGDHPRGLSKETPALTVNKVCGSGLKAIALGASAIMTGRRTWWWLAAWRTLSLAPMAMAKPAGATA